MIICTGKGPYTNHKRIIHEGDNCPLCEALRSSSVAEIETQEARAKLIQLERKIDELQKRVSS